jgi:hypothetical protein
MEREEGVEFDGAMEVPENNCYGKETDIPRVECEMW